MTDNMHDRLFSVVPDQTSITAISEFLDTCLEEFDVPVRAGYTLKVVADEIISNIVYYSGAKKAEILFRNDPEHITLLFRDDGIPYNPLEAREPDVTAGIGEREIGGLGLFMVKKMAESVCYEHTGSQNQLTVVLSKAAKKKKLSLEDF